MAKSVAKITIDATKALRELESVGKKIKEDKPKLIWREETKETIESINNALEEVELKISSNGNYYYEKKQTPTPWTPD